MKIVISIFIFLLSFSFSPLSGKHIKRVPKNGLRIGILEIEDKKEMTRNFKAIAKYIYHQHNIPILIYFAKDPTTLVRGLKFKRLDIAYLDVNGVVKALKEAKAKLLVIEETINGKRYYPYVITNRKSGIHLLQDIHTLGVSQKQSLDYKLYKRENSKLKLRYFAINIPSQTTAINRIVEMSIDGILVNENILRKYRDKYQGVFKILWKSKKSLPNFALVTSSNVSDRLNKKLQNILINFNDEKVLKRMGIKKFVPISNIEYKKLLP